SCWRNFPARRRARLMCRPISMPTASSCRQPRMSERPDLRDAAWLKIGEVARLLALLDRDGEEARVVGGAVRNGLMRLPVDEIDVATTAVPDEVTCRAEAVGFKAV